MSPYASGNVVIAPRAESPAVDIMRGPLIGSLIAMALYGVTCLQTAFYFRAYPGDRWSLKALVCLVWALETAHACLSMVVLDKYLIQNFGNDVAIESTGWDFTVLFILGFLTDFVVYIYFTWMIWTFTRRIWVALFMLLVVVARTGVSLWGCVNIVVYESWLHYRDGILSINIAGSMLFIVGDAFSAAIFAYYLRRSLLARKDSPTNRLLHRLVVYAVATGALTCLTDIATLIVTLQSRDNLNIAGLLIIQAKIYANSLLASLNVRNLNRRVLSTPAMMSLDFDLESMSTDTSNSIHFVGDLVVESRGSAMLSATSSPTPAQDVDLKPDTNSSTSATIVPSYDTDSITERVV